MYTKPSEVYRDFKFNNQGGPRNDLGLLVNPTLATSCCILSAIELVYGKDTPQQQEATLKLALYWNFEFDHKERSCTTMFGQAQWHIIKYSAHELRNAEDAIRVLTAAGL